MRDLHVTLGTLVQADAAAGDPDMFVLYYGGEGPLIIGHTGWSDDEQPPTSLEVDELEDRGWVRVSERQGKGRHFAVTGEGRRAWQQRSALLSPPTQREVDLSWPTVRAVLHDVFEAYAAAGAPDSGIKTPGLVEAAENPDNAAAAIRELVRDGYLDVLFSGQGDVPIVVRPTAKTLQLEAGWPGGPAEALVNDLVVALDHEIDSTEEPEKRSALVKVRDGLLGAGRDFVVAYLAAKA